MDGIVWLVCSWVVVALLSYIFVTRSEGGAPRITDNVPNSTYITKSGEKSDWVNEVIAWLSTYKSFPVGLSEHWIKALNDVAKKICAPGQNEVAFEESRSSIDASQYPKISNLESCRNSNGHLVLKGHLEVPSAMLRVIESENLENYTKTTNYNASLKNLVGELEARLAFIADEVYLMVCFNNRPEMDVTLTNADRPSEAMAYSPDLDSNIRKCITSAVMSINFHEYISSLREDPSGRSYIDDSYPYNENLASSRHAPPNHITYDRSLFVYHPPQPSQQSHPSQSPYSSQPSYPSRPSHSPNKIQIKLIKAQRLNFEDINDLQPYVTVEIDEPGQKFTSTPSRTVNPHWDQNAEFFINDLSDEVLFEVYGRPVNMDDKNTHFLGLAIAGLGEMRKSNERVHNLQLQSRPYHNDKVSGILTIQSEFFHDPYAQINMKKKPPGKQHNKSAFTFTEPYSTKSQIGNSTPPYEYHPKPTNHAVKFPVNTPDQYHNEGNSVLDNVANGVDFTELVDRPHREPLANQNQQQTIPRQTSRQLSSTYVSADENNPPHWIELEKAQLIPDNGNVSDIERGRSTKKSHPGKRERSFFGELKDRLTRGHSRSKKRAKSLDAHNPVLDETPSEPPSRDQSQTRHERLSCTGTIERPQRGGNRSPAYNEGPTMPTKLVLELGEEWQEKKYYYIPDYVEEQLRATKIMKKGKKLHLCNEHSFVAVKTKGSVSCDVCGGRIATNFVKQAYQCRDCRLVTHKHCHRKIGHFSCPSSTLGEKYIVEDVNWEELLGRFQNGEEEFISGENL